MNRKKHQALIKAADLLSLDDRASRDEIKKAYHRLCKKYHPDTNTSGKKHNHEMLCQLTNAYELLMRYCDEYKIPLRFDEKDIEDDEDWWLNRFGQDPLWGKNHQKS